MFLYLFEKLLFCRTSQFDRLIQWVVLEYRFPFYFSHCLLEEGSCLKSKLYDYHLIAAFNTFKISSRSWNIQYTENRKRVSHWKLYSIIKHFSKGYFTFALSSQSFCNFRMNHCSWEGGPWDPGTCGQNLGPQHAMFRIFGLLCLLPLSCDPPFSCAL